MYTLDEDNNTPPPCILCALMPQIIPLHKLTLVHMRLKSPPSRLTGIRLLIGPWVGSLIPLLTLIIDTIHLPIPFPSQPCDHSIENASLSIIQDHMVN
jgi:hypothetical protein